MTQHSPTTATLLGVPIDLGARNLGVDIGPDAFRYQDILSKLQTAGLDLIDAGTVPCTERSKVDIGSDPKHKYLSEVLKVTADTAGRVEDIIKDGRTAIVVGGDHSLTLGTVAGASAAVNGDLGVIYFDAHGDMNTPETTPTGNIHGMHLAALMGFGASELVNLHHEGAKIDKNNLVHIGGCDFDQAELDLVAREQLHAFSIADLLRHGLGPAFDMVDGLCQRVNNIWISLDLDSIDSLYAPGAGMPNPKGLSYREITALAEYIGRRCPVVGLDIVEYNPLQDVDRKTAELGIELIAMFLGKHYSWYSNYLAQNSL